MTPKRPVQSVIAQGACATAGAAGRMLPVVMALALISCASSLSTAPGLFASYPRERLPVDGFPDIPDEEYFGAEWGVLYEADGTAYGPNSLYFTDQRLTNPYLVVTDSTLANRYIRIRRTATASEPVTGHFVELIDLARHDLTETLGITPSRTIEVVSAADLSEWKTRFGHDYWLTHTVDANGTPQIEFEPIPTLFARTIAVHAIRNAVAQLYLQQMADHRLPAWLYYGLSSYLAEEGNMLVSFVNEFRDSRPVLLPPSETTRYLQPLADRENGRIALYNAFLMTWHLSEQWGFDRVRTLLRAVASGKDIDAAAEVAYGRSWAEVEAMVDPRKLGEPQGSRFHMRTAPPPANPTP